MTVITLVVLGVYDAVVYVVWGGATTISTLFGEWYSAAYWGWAALIVAGLVAGHLVGMMNPATEHFYLRVAAAVAAATIGFVLTART